MSATRRRCVLATGNPGKLRELAELLEGLPFEVVSQATLGIESPPETGLTFVENALLKARHAARESGLPAIADDSGLEVDALDGAPGIRSARYAGEDASDERNLRALLSRLRGLPEPERGARYRCVVVMLRHALDPAPILCAGEWEGRIAEHPRGAGGFGYDPVFELPQLGKTAAELDPAVKNRTSHRARALAGLREALDRAAAHRGGH